jgi:hypothetical protein
MNSEELESKKNKEVFLGRLPISESFLVRQRHLPSIARILMIPLGSS